MWAAVGEPRNSSTFTEPGCEGCELLQTPEGWTMPAPSEVERPATSEPDFSMVSSARINHQDFIQKSAHTALAVKACLLGGKTATLNAQ